MSIVEQFLIEVAESAVLANVEPGPIQFTRAHELDVPRVTAAIRGAANGELVRFDSPVNRNGFLCGCLDYTDAVANEHLIVGYGARFGSTTRIESVHHVLGNRNSVRIPPHVLHAISQHTARDTKSETILFHNHPLNLLNLFADNLPIASRTDRLTLMQFALGPHQVLLSLLGEGRVLFYLGENGFVKQFRLPSLLSVLQQVRSYEAAQESRF